ncbi:MAG: ribosomal protein S18-alanine N-acetyltransferase [Egibacteraceae bacterium]
MTLARRDPDALRVTSPRGTTRGALDSVRIVPLRRRHLRGVLKIEQQVYPRPWSSALFASELGQPETRRYLVALAPRSALGRSLPGRAVAGYAGVMVAVGEAHITTVAVHPRHHRRKVASRLVLGVLREAVAMGAKAATLEVRDANRGAQRLYAAFGFVPVGVRPGYYAETGENAVIMWAHDLQSDGFAARLAAQERRLDRPGGASGAPDHHVPWVRGRVGLPRTEQRG